jgi:hypothetical protein
VTAALKDEDGFGRVGIMQYPTRPQAASGLCVVKVIGRWCR